MAPATTACSARRWCKPSPNCVRTTVSPKGFTPGLASAASTSPTSRPPRSSGTSAWNPRRLWLYALDGIFSFSVLPLKVWTLLGLVISLLSLIYAFYRLTITLVFGIDVPGWTTLVVAILFLGGVQLIGIGILGEYVGRIYMESKRRPAYFVRDIHPAPDPRPEPHVAAKASDKTLAIRRSDQARDRSAAVQRDATRPTLADAPGRANKRAGCEVRPAGRITHAPGAQHPSKPAVGGNAACRQIRALQLTEALQQQPFQPASTQQHNHSPSGNPTGKGSCTVRTQAKGC